MRVKIEHRLGIQAPPEAIWALVADIGGWARWNPLYPKAGGAIRIGSPLTLELALPGRKPQTIRPVVVDWVPNEQILWRLSMLGGLLKSTRYLEIEQLTETGCIFSMASFSRGWRAPPWRGGWDRRSAPASPPWARRSRRAWKRRGGRPSGRLLEGR